MGGLVGRAAELAELADLVDRARRGEGGAMLIGGEPGIGKTRLAEAAAARAGDAGLAVAWGRCRESDGAPPFWPWAQVMRALGASVDQSGDRFRLFEAVADALRGAGGLLVVLDDVHRADEGSLRLLSFVADHLWAAPVALVVTYRDAEAGTTLTQVLTELATQRVCRRRILGGLSVAELTTWLAGTGLPASDVHDRTGGNPFFVGELVRLLAAGDATLPVGVRDVVRRRVSSLASSTQDALAGAAVLGREFAVAALAALLGQGPDTTAAVLRQAVDAHLINGDGPRRRFVHALVPETILADLDPRERTALHARALAVLPFSAAPEPSVVAHHALHARGLVPDDDARAAVVEAAEDADRRLAWEDSVVWWRHAVELGASGVELGRALLRCGKVDEARMRFEVAAADARRRGDGRLLAEAALLVGETVAEIAPDRALLALLDEALTSADIDERTRVRLAARRAMTAFWMPDGTAGARRAGAQIVAAARLSGDDHALGAALIARQFTLRGPDDLAERITVGEEVRALAERRGDDELRFRACQWLIPDLFQAGELFAVTTAVDVGAGIA